MAVTWALRAYLVIAVQQIGELVAEEVLSKGRLRAMHQKWLTGDGQSFDRAGGAKSSG